MKKYPFPMRIELTGDLGRRRLLGDKHSEYITRAAFGNSCPFEHLKRYVLGRLLSEGELKVVQVLPEMATILKRHGIGKEEAKQCVVQALGVINAYNEGDGRCLDLGEYGTGLAA